MMCAVRIVIRNKLSGCCLRLPPVAAAALAPAAFVEGPEERPVGRDTDRITRMAVGDFV